MTAPFSSGGLDLASIGRLSNPNEISKASFSILIGMLLASYTYGSNAMQVLHETQAKERSIEEELEKLLQQREQLEGMLLQLHSSTREVRQGCAACCSKQVPDNLSPQQLTNSRAVTLCCCRGRGLAVQAACQVACLP